MSSPSNAVICPSGTATFSVTAAGSGPFTYQWQWQQVGGGGVWTNVVEGVNADSLVGGGGIPRFTAAGAAASSIAVARTNTPQGALDVIAALRCIVTNACGSVTSNPARLYVSSADFNNDGDIGTDQDIEAFFACLGGHCCPTCGTADFNGDGDTGTDQDIEAFFRVLAGGNC